jgi:hypothetical protein
LTPRTRSPLVALTLEPAQAVLLDDVLPEVRDEGLAAGDEAHIDEALRDLVIEATEALLLGGEVVVRDGGRASPIVTATVDELILVGRHVHVQRLGTVQEQAALPMPVRWQWIELLVDLMGTAYQA